MPDMEEIKRYLEEERLEEEKKHERQKQKMEEWEQLKQREDADYKEKWRRREEENPMFKNGPAPTPNFRCFRFCHLPSFCVSPDLHGSVKKKSTSFAAAKSPVFKQPRLLPT